MLEIMNQLLLSSQSPLHSPFPSLRRLAKVIILEDGTHTNENIRQLDVTVKLSQNSSIMSYTMQIMMGH